MLAYFKRKREEKERERQRKQRAAEEQREKKVNAAKKTILDMAERYLQDEIDQLTQRTPKPFEPGDVVVLDYYTYDPHRARGSFWTTAEDFLSTFHYLPSVAGPMVFAVKDCFVDSRVKDAFDFGYSSGAADLLERIVSGNLINPAAGDYSVEQTFREYWFKVKGSSPVVDWMVKIDWEKAKIPYEPGKKGYLHLNWGKGDFVWYTLLPIESQVAKDQILLWEEHLKLEKSRAELAEQSKEHLANIEFFQKRRRAQSFGAHYESVADFLAGNRNTK